MQIPFLHQQIILETEKLRDMHRSLMMHNSAIPATEMESFLQQLRKLYEVTLQLSNENSLNLMNEIFYANELKIKHQSAEIALNLNHQPVNAAVNEIKQPASSNSVMAREVVQEHQPVSVNNQPPVASIPTQQPVVAKTPVQATAQQASSVSRNHFPNSNSQTVAKKFTESATVADKIAGIDHSKRFSDSIKLPVSDINAAIGINEKFQFINQLFHGDSQKYSQFVSELNSCPSADIAKQSIQQIADANHWESIPVAKHFIEVVERRFA